VVCAMDASGSRIGIGGARGVERGHFLRRGRKLPRQPEDPKEEGEEGGLLHGGK